MRAKSVMFKVLTIIISITFISISGCNRQEKAEPTDPNKKSVGLILAIGGLGDNSVNDSAFAGLKRAKQELSVDVKHLEPRETAEFAEHLRLFAEKKTNLIIGVGSSMKVPIEMIAPEYPDSIFAIIDVPATGENVLSLVFREHEGAYLAGQVSALMTQSQKVGFIGGMDIPLLRKWQKGFEEGVKSLNDSIDIDSRYLDVKVQGFNDPIKGKAVALSMYSGGVDVILQVTGGSASGIYNAAKERNKYAIGSDLNQDSDAPGLILTSVVRDVEQVIFNTISKMKTNELSGGTLSFGLKEDGVHLTDFSYTKNILGNEKLKIIEDTTLKIISGSIIVTDSTKTK